MFAFWFVFFWFFLAELPIQTMALLGQTNTTGGCPAARFDRFVCLHRKHCVSKERPKGEMPCSKSGNQALD